MGITEDPHDARARPEPRNAIRIPQSARSSWSWHVPIMPDSRAASSAFPTAPRAGVRTLSPLFSPTHFHEDPENVCHDVWPRRGSNGWTLPPKAEVPQRRPRLARPAPPGRVHRVAMWTLGSVAPATAPVRPLLLAARRAHPRGQVSGLLTRARSARAENMACSPHAAAWTSAPAAAFATSSCWFAFTGAIKALSPTAAFEANLLAWGRCSGSG
jgi:hypothetical protein